MREVERFCKNCAWLLRDSLDMDTCTCPDSIMCAEWPDPYDCCPYWVAS